MGLAASGGDDGGSLEEQWGLGTVFMVIEAGEVSLTSSLDL